MDKQTLTRQQLYNLVWAEPIYQLAKKYQISDTGLRKRCLKYNIPVPPVGYWSKVQYGKKVRKIPLPKYVGEVEIILYPKGREGEDPEASIASRVAQRKLEIEQDPNVNLEVPENLSNVHPLISSTRKKRRHKGWDDWEVRDEEYRSLKSLSISVTSDQMNRAYRLMDTLLKILESRGHKAELKYGNTVLKINEIDFEIRLREREKVVKPHEKYQTRELEPTGDFILMLKWYHKEWRDGKDPLEKQLSKIVAWMEIKAYDEYLENQRSKVRSWIREMKDWLENEKVLRIKAEITRYQNLLEEAQRWHTARIIREYVTHIEQHGILNHEENWPKWANEKADWLDPTVGKKDNLLGIYNLKYIKQFLERKTNYGYQDYYPDKEDNYFRRKWYL